MIEQKDKLVATRATRIVIALTAVTCVGAVVAAAPIGLTFGNVGRNTLQGPRLYETDLSLAKRFTLHERLNLQFRAEFFNVFNQVNFNTPNPVVYAAATGGPSPTAGVITSTATTSRQVQLGLKLLW